MTFGCRRGVRPHFQRGGQGQNAPPLQNNMHSTISYKEEYSSASQGKSNTR